MALIPGSAIGFLLVGGLGYVATEKAQEKIFGDFEPKTTVDADGSTSTTLRPPLERRLLTNTINLAGAAAAIYISLEIGILG